MRSYSRSFFKLQDKQIEAWLSRVRPLPKFKRLWNGRFYDGRPRKWSV